MNPITPIPVSFRDPSGQVYQIDGRKFWTVNDCFAKETEFVQSTGILQNLATQGLILPIGVFSSDIPSPLGVKSVYVLETQMLPSISFPYEWPFSALKAASLLHFQIHVHALEIGVTLSEASAYNIQFQGSQPIFIDHLAFNPYRTGEIWAGHRQFCEQILNLLLLRAYFGVPHNAWYGGAQEGNTSPETRSLLTWRHFWQLNVLTHVFPQDILQQTATTTTTPLEENPSATVLFPLSSFKRLLGKFCHWIANLQPLKTVKFYGADHLR